MRTIRQILDLYVDSTVRFVIQHQGALDDAVVNGFYDDLRRRGFEISSAGEKQVREMLVSAANLYRAAAQTEGMERRLSDLLRILVDFMTETHLAWGSEDWDRLTGELRHSYAGLAEEGFRYAGNFMESMRDASYRQRSGFLEWVKRVLSFQPIQPIMLRDDSTETL